MSNNTILNLRKKKKDTYDAYLQAIYELGIAERAHKDALQKTCKHLRTEQVYTEYPDGSLGTGTIKVKEEVCKDCGKKLRQAYNKEVWSNYE